MSENLTPWAERDIDQLREWNRLRVEERERYDREQTECLCMGQGGDCACRKCGHVMCSCPKEAEEKVLPAGFCPRCEHAFDDDGACHNVLCGVEEPDWADHVYPHGSWEIDPVDDLPLRRRPNNNAGRLRHVPEDEV